MIIDAVIFMSEFRIVLYENDVNRRIVDLCFFGSSAQLPVCLLCQMIAFYVATQRTVPCVPVWHKKFIAQRAASLERITSPKGIQLRMNRSIQSEGAFGVIKQDYGFRQFLLRGNKKVTTEILLLAMAYDVNKLHSKIQNNRTGTQLFIKDSA